MNFHQTDRQRASESSATLPRVTRTRNNDSGFLRCGRRGFLRTAGGVAVAGLLAGCISEDSEGSTGADGDDGSEGDTETNGDSDGRSVDNWLADTGNYDGIKDLTSTDSATVEVGAEGNSGPNAFEPAAIEISPRTTATWEWVDGFHDVVATDGEFSSGEPEQNATFEHTFETPGTVLYSCTPHESMDMKGAVIVAEDDGETAGDTSDQPESR